MNALAQKIDSFIQKQAKIYLRPGEQPPKGAQVMRGKRGGMFYVPQGLPKKLEQPSSERSQGEEKYIMTSSKYEQRSDNIDYLPVSDAQRLIEDAPNNDYRQAKKETSRIKRRRKSLQFIGKDVVEKFRKGEAFTRDDFNPEFLRLIDDYEKTPTYHNHLKLRRAIVDLFSEVGLGELHDTFTGAWDISPGHDLCRAVKISIARQFGSKVYTDDAKKFKDKANEAFNKYGADNINKYVKIMYNFTQSFLDAVYPKQDKFVLYRGTTSNELEGDKKVGRNADIKSGAASSWSSVRKKGSMFGRFLVESEVPKEMIFITYLTGLPETGRVKEHLMIGGVPLKGTILKDRKKTVEWGIFGGRELVPEEKHKYEEVKLSR